MTTAYTICTGRYFVHSILPWPIDHRTDFIKLALFNWNHEFCGGISTVRWCSPLLNYWILGIFFGQSKSLALNWFHNSIHCECEEDFKVKFFQKSNHWRIQRENESRNGMRDEIPKMSCILLVFFCYWKITIALMNIIPHEAKHRNCKRKTFEMES